MTDPTPPADPAERRTRYASAMARRDGDTWPTTYEDAEADYLRRATAAISVADAEQAELRTANERMRHELEVMYGGSFDKLPEAAATVPASAHTEQALSWAESVASHGTGPTATVDIDVNVPGSTEPQPLEIPLDAARVLHSMLGDAIGQDAAPPTDRTALRARIAALFRSAPGQERLGDATPGEIADAVLARIPGSAIRVAEDADALRSDLYDDLDQFARETGNTGLRHAQIRDHLATFLAEGLLRRLADTASGPGRADDEAPHLRAARYAAAGNEMAASLVRDGFGDDEIATMLSGSADEITPARHTCRNQTTAAGPDWLCPHCSTLPRRVDGKTQQDEPAALPLLFWDEPAGVVHEDGRITAWLSKAVSLAQAEPAGQLILQPDAAARLLRALTTALSEADDAREAAERAAASCRDAEGCHRVVPCVPGCAARWQPAAVSQPGKEA